MNRILKESVKAAHRSGVLVPGRSTCSTTQAPSMDVPGLSKKVLELPPYEVGFPRASKAAAYKNPEYFCYHNASYFEAEVEMNKYRLPQPSNKTVKNM